MIGLFDSGSGGLTILSALRQRFPDRDFLYLGDHARAPYGHRTNRDIVDYTREGVDHLMKAGCTLVILACNTAAAVALRSLQQTWLGSAHPGKRVLGVLVPMVESLTGQPWGITDSVNAGTGPHHSVLLFATRKTVESGAYADEIKKRAPGIRLTQKACPGLVDAIEGGAGPLPLRGLVSGYVTEALKTMGHSPDAVFLGCTHFPLLEDMFREALVEAGAKDIAILAQPDTVAQALRDYLSRHHMLVPRGTGQVTLLTSGDPTSLDHLFDFLDHGRDGQPLGWPSFRAV